jgi:acetoin utilization deacetylase AcuC-like enzyme
LNVLISISVLTGKSKNSFCVVRPPGHHAGVNGLLEGGESCGFCIFNNVAAGAMHALAEYKDACQRVAIVDIDVHHGNGTEEIVRKCNDPSTLFFFSIHLFDNDEVTMQSKKKNHQMYKFYPGTGCNDDLAMNIINVPILPLWKDVQTKPTSLEPKTHNTRKKLRSVANSSISQQETNVDDSSESNNPLISSSTNSSSRHSDGESSTATTTQQLQQSASSSTMVPMTTSLAGTILTLPGRMAYRQAITSRLLPSLRAFNPDLILISAGFDASSGDVGNARHEKDRERMGMDLTPDDYAWTTRQILQIADICCQGRVVSILEGGYGRTPLSETTVAMTQAETKVAATTLDREIFGECAIRHLHALIDPYDVEQRFG